MTHSAAMAICYGEWRDHSLCRIKVFEIRKKDIWMSDFVTDMLV